MRSAYATAFAVCVSVTAAPAEAQISGRVHDDTSRGIPAARVRVVTDSVTDLDVVADSTGRYRISDVPIGEIRLEVEALGFEGTSRTVPYDGRALTVDIRVGRAPLELDGLDVRVAVRNAYLDRSGFYRRREFGTGRFVDLEAETVRPTVRTAQIFQRVAGVQVRGDAEPVFTRNAGMCSRGKLPLVVVDDLLVRGQGDLRAFDLVAPPAREISAVELYSGGTVPARWRSAGALCGVIAIWTRR